MTVLAFLTSLRKNNSKEWFDANRKTYELVKKEVQDLTTALIKAVSNIDPTLAHLTHKDCLFRINRDVRFSKDKSPYKTNMGIYLCAGGKKSMMAGYYLHIEPGASFIGGGLYMPIPESLGKVRQEIDYNLHDFEKIISAKPFINQFGGLHDGEDKLIRVPKGYEVDNPAAEYLKHKSFIVMKSISDKDIQRDKLMPESIRAFQALKPLVYFLNSAMAE